MQLIPFYRKKPLKSDEALLQDYLQTGNIDALGELYAKYMDLLYGLCLKYFKSSEQAKDAVIQLFEKVMIEIGKHEISNFRNWLYVVAKNYCLMELRKAKPGQTISIFNDEALVAFMENGEEMHPIDKEPHARNEAALQECIAKLKNEQQQCIRLFYFEDKSYQQICALLQLEEKRVKSYIQNGKRNLKICLERNNDID